MAKNSRVEADPPPTMIIPRDTEIQVDSHGQLSIRAPGNLVIQNSGHYGEIESVHGSIRIEANAEVERLAVQNKMLNAAAEEAEEGGRRTQSSLSAKLLMLDMRTSS